MELTKTEISLVALLKARNLDMDTCVCVMLRNRKEEQQKKLITWINDNPKAGQTEICQHIWA